MQQENRWFLASDEEEAGSLLMGEFESLANDDTARQSNYSLYLKLYGGARALNTIQLVDAGMFDSTQSDNRLKLNIVRPIVDSICSSVSVNMPRIQFVTEGGSYSARRKAKKCTQYLDGLFQKLRVYPECLQVFKDAALFGTGAIKVGLVDGEIEIERVLPNEIYVEPYEARYGKPRTLYCRKIYDKYVLAHIFPEHKELIMESSLSTESDNTFIRNDISDPVEVVEAWHLPSGKEATDGRHVIAIQNATLLDEEYTQEKFPIVLFRYESLPLGIWGVGLAEMLTEIQMRINGLLRKIHEHLSVASSHIMVQEGSILNYEELNNAPFGVIRHTSGMAPVFMSIQAISPEYYQVISDLYQKAFEEVGLSHFTATANKPAGLERISQPALAELRNMQDSRWNHIIKNWDQFFVEIADRIIRLSKESGELKVVYNGKESVETIYWSDLDFDPDEDSYVIRSYPTNLLPQEPGGRVDKIIQMVQGGVITPQQSWHLMDNPDIKAATSREFADQELMDKIIGALYEGRFIGPEPNMNLEMAIQEMTKAYLEASTFEDIEEDILDSFRSWIGQAEQLIQMAQAPAPAPAPMQMDPSMAQGMPPGMPQEGMPAEGQMPAMPPDMAAGQIQ